MRMDWFVEFINMVAAIELSTIYITDVRLGIYKNMNIIIFQEARKIFCLKELYLSLK